MHKCWYIVHCVSVDSVMFWQMSLKLVLHYLGFTHEHKYFSLSQLHWWWVWYYARIITRLHILNLLFLPMEAITQYTYCWCSELSSSPSSSRNKMQQNHVRSNKTCTVWQASFQIKKITLYMYTFEKRQAIFLISGWASVHKNNV